MIPAINIFVWDYIFFFLFGRRNSIIIIYMFTLYAEMFSHR